MIVIPRKRRAYTEDMGYYPRVMLLFVLYTTNAYLSSTRVTAESDSP